MLKQKSCFAFSDALAAILEQLLESPIPSREPENLVREAAQGHMDTVRAMVVKQQDKVSRGLFQKTPQSWDLVNH